MLRPKIPKYLSIFTFLAGQSVVTHTHRQYSSVDSFSSATSTDVHFRSVSDKESSVMNEANFHFHLIDLLQDKNKDEEEESEEDETGEPTEGGKKGKKVKKKKKPPEAGYTADVQ